MEENLELMTNDELKTRYDEVVKEFAKVQTAFKENYLQMLELSKQSVTIKNIITKRGGKINEQQ